MFPIILFAAMDLNDGLDIQALLRSRGFAVPFVIVVALFTLFWFRRRDRKQGEAMSQGKSQAAR